MTEKTDNSSQTIKPRSMRWWPLLVIGLAWLGRVIYAHYKNPNNQQQINLDVAIACIFAFLLIFLWLLLFSRLRWKKRFSILGVLVGLGVLMAGMFEIVGVSGNLLPILRWRWASPQGLDLSALTATNHAAPVALTQQMLSGAADFPQFLGPNRNATLPGPRLARDWEAKPPELLWRQPIGLAWSGFAVKGSFAVTQEQQGENELVVCYEVQSGKPLWAHAYPARYDNKTVIAGEGPRATPTIDDERVFTLGATGILNCLELASGRLLWSTNIVESNGGKINEWGLSGSPLILGDKVVVNAGGKKDRSLVAYNKRSGQFLWGGGTDRAGYSSPCLFTLAEVPQILIFNARHLVAHNPETGEVLWEYDWGRGRPHVAVPVILPEDQLLVSSGYGVGAERLQVTKKEDGSWKATRIWKSNRMKAKFTNLVYRDGHIYGLDDGIMACIDVEEGDRQWKDGRYGHGQVLLVEDVLLVMAESGEVFLLEPVPTELRELTRFQALDGKTWNPPALAGEYLLVRNDLEAACYRLPVEGR